jgi:formylglycine-generating enzyme required for sulfatase activity
VGILLYEILTGQPPFSGPIPVLMGQHLQLSPPPLPEEIPVGIQREVERLLAKKREDRPADAWSVRGALEAGLKSNEEQHTIMLPREETPAVKVDVVKDEVTGRQARQKQETLEEVSSPLGPKNIQDRPNVNGGPVHTSRRPFPWRIALSLFAVVGVIGLVFLFLPQRKEKSQPQEEPKAVAQQPKEEPKTGAVQPPIPQTTPAPQVTDSQKVQSSVDDNMVLVPAGEFFMGCNEKVDNQCVGSEKPGRKVFLDAFKIDKTEVTVAEYGQCVKAGKCSAPDTRERARCNWQQAGKENHPINCVDWNQAVAFCQWDKNKRLPTEAEWEKAARGIDGRVYPWGNKWDVKKANVDGKADGFEYTAPVGSFPGGVSPYGNFDMGGNVWEWTQDWYDKNYYQDGPTENPRGADKGDDKVVRGGSWFDVAWIVRASNRIRFGPGGRYESVGVRCAQ